jgi:hypothetical protein
LVEIFETAWPVCAPTVGSGAVLVKEKIG